jgi:hypothetical protein
MRILTGAQNDVRLLKCSKEVEVIYKEFVNAK